MTDYNVSFFFMIGFVIACTIFMIYFLFKAYDAGHQKSVSEQIKFDIEFMKEENDFLFIWYIVKDYLKLYNQYLKQQIKVNSNEFSQVLNDGPHGRNLNDVKCHWIALHDNYMKLLSAQKSNTSIFEAINTLIVIGLDRLAFLSQDKIK